MKTIVVPIDFSPVSRRVVAQAHRLAELIRARLLFVHVVQPPPVVATDVAPMYDHVAMYITEASHYADRQLSRLRTRLRAKGLTVATLRRIGAPGPTIIEEAKRSGAKYIVIGSHGHTAFFDLLVGSTTSAVLKRSSCPVLVVPALRTKLRKSGK